MYVDITCGYKVVLKLKAFPLAQSLLPGYFTYTSPYPAHIKQFVFKFIY